MADLFPAFNAEEQRVVGPIDPARRDAFAEMLRIVTAGVERPA
jgi:hypothetical protein